MSFGIQQQLLFRHMEQLVGDRNPYTCRPALDAAADYISGCFQGLGWEVQFDTFKMGRQTHHNIVANLESLNPSQPLLLVGAHYDSVPGSPGADDNASAVAALLELARVYSVRPPPAPLRLVAFTLEESDLQGSRHYAETLRRGGATLRGMVSLEMLGYKSDEPHSQRLPPQLASLYPHTANFIGVVGNEHSRKFLEIFVRGMKAIADLPIETMVVPGNGASLPDTRRSDHSPFWDNGYCAIMVTDTSNFRNPHYHQPTDTVDTVDLNFLKLNTEALAHGIAAALKSSC